MYYEYVRMHVLMYMYVYIYVCASVCMHMCLCWEGIFEERELTYPDSESICYFPVVG